MTRQEVTDAIAALEAAGTPVTTRNIHQHLGRGSMRDLQRHIRAIQQEQLDMRASQQEQLATAVMEPPETALEPPSVPDSVPATLQAVTDAEAAFGAAKAHVEALKQQHAQALRQHGLLMAAWQSRTITRQDPAWHDFDQACAQIHAAEQAVQRAEQDLQYARQAYDLHCYELAAAEVAQTPDGQALLAKIDDYQRQREAADEKGSPAAFSWGMIKAQVQQQFRDLVNVHRGLMQPKTPTTEAQRQQAFVGAVERMQQENPARESVRYNAFR